jgi:hypothetical protein
MGQYIHEIISYHNSFQGVNSYGWMNNGSCFAIDSENALINDWLNNNLPLSFRELELASTFDYLEKHYNSNYQNDYSSAINDLASIHLEANPVNSFWKKEQENNHVRDFNEHLYAITRIKKELKVKKQEQGYKREARALTEDELKERHQQLERYTPLIEQMNSLGGVITWTNIHSLLNNLDQFNNHYSVDQIEAARQQLLELLSQAQAMINKLPVPSNTDWRLTYLLIDEKECLKTLLNSD